MKPNNQKNYRWAILATVIALVIIGGSYTYSHQRENHYLAEEKALYEGKKDTNTTKQEDSSSQAASKQAVTSIDTLAKEFSDRRDKASVLSYLAYIKKQGDTPTITSIKTMAGKRDWVKEALDQALKNTELSMDDINYQSVEAVRENSYSLNNSNAIDQIQKQSPQLVIIPFPNAADVRDGLSVSDSIDEALTLYQNVRLADANANVLFISQPAESEEINTNSHFTEGVPAFGKGLQEQQYNWLNLVTDDVTKNLQYDDDGLNKTAIDQLRDTLAEAFSDSQWRFNVGYKGDNDSEISSLKQASESASIASSKASSEAASIAESQAEAAAQASREAASSALQSSILESQQLEQQQAQQSQQSSLQNNQQQSQGQNNQQSNNVNNGATTQQDGQAQN